MKGNAVAGGGPIYPKLTNKYMVESVLDKRIATGKAKHKGRDLRSHGGVYNFRMILFSVFDYGKRLEVRLSFNDILLDSNLLQILFTRQESVPLRDYTGVMNNIVLPILFSQEKKIELYEAMVRMYGKESD